jgi:hypothetical protein
MEHIAFFISVLSVVQTCLIQLSPCDYSKRGSFKSPVGTPNRYRAELPAFETVTTGISVIHGCPRQMSISIRASTMLEQ